jgi:uncharacterized membrane protein YdcZ (DUF606 family)
MVVLEVIIAAVVVVCVVGGLFFVLVLDRAGKPLKMDARVWWWSLVGLGLVGAGIAWITSAIF